MNEPESSQPSDNGRLAVNWLVVAVQAVAFSVAVMLRKRFGERHVGLQATVAVPVILLWTLFWPHDDARPMFVFLLFYFLACMYARLSVLYRRRRGELIHTRYDGESCLMRLLPRWSEVQVKKTAEPAAVFLCGLALLPLSRPLGAYLMLACLALAVEAALYERRDRLLLLDLNDSMLDQQDLGERFRRR